MPSAQKICERCPYLNQCTHSQAHVKVVTRHVWQAAVDEADENRYRYDLQDLYKYRKETLWFSQGAVWFPLYTAIWESADGSKGCAYLRMPKSQKASKKAVEKPPYSLAISVHFGLLFPFFQHLRSKPAFGLSQ